MKRNRNVSFDIRYDGCRKSIRLLSISEEKDKQSRLNQSIAKSSDKSNSKRSNYVSRNKFVKSTDKNRKRLQVDDTTDSSNKQNVPTKYKTVIENYYHPPLTRNQFTDDDIQYCSCKPTTGCGVNCENRLLYM